MFLVRRIGFPLKVTGEVIGGIEKRRLVRDRSGLAREDIGVIVAATKTVHILVVSHLRGDRLHDRVVRHVIAERDSGRRHVIDQVAARMSVPDRDTLRSGRLGAIEVAETIDRVVRQVAVYLHAHLIRDAIKETLDILVPLAVVFLCVPLGCVGFCQQLQWTVTRRTRSFGEETLTLNAIALRQPYALDRTGVVLVRTDSARLTPVWSYYPHRCIARLLIGIDGVFAQLSLYSVHAKVITLAVIYCRERHIGTGRNDCGRIIYVSTT